MVTDQSTRDHVAVKEGACEAYADEEVLLQAVDGGQEGLGHHHPAQAPARHAVELAES